KSLSQGDQENVKDARYAFVTVYEADALGTPDPTWNGKQPRSIQTSKYELCVLAQLALWLARPSPLCFSIVIHARQDQGEPRVQQVNRHTATFCHPNDVDQRIATDDLPLAQRLHGALAQVSHTSAVGVAARAAWSA